MKSPALAATRQDLQRVATHILARRPDESAYWNASFGAVIPRSAVSSVADAGAFYREGLSCLIG